MGWARLAICVLLTSGTAGAAAAQTPVSPAACDGSSDAARKLKFDGEAPFAGASISYALARDCASILLYRLMPKHADRPIPVGVSAIEWRRNPPPDERPKTGPPHFYARVQTRQGLSGDGSTQLLWADQKTCTALLPAVEALEKALAPKLTGDGPARDGSIGVTMDGAGVVVWAAGQVYPISNMSHRFNVFHDTNLGTPTADWVEATLKQLAPCLSSDIPTPDPPIP